MQMFTWEKCLFNQTSSKFPNIHLKNWVLGVPGMSSYIHFTYWLHLRKQMFCLQILQRSTETFSSSRGSCGSDDKRFYHCLFGGEWEGDGSRGWRDESSLYFEGFVNYQPKKRFFVIVVSSTFSLIFFRRDMDIAKPWGKKTRCEKCATSKKKRPKRNHHHPKLSSLASLFPFTPKK